MGPATPLRGLRVVALEQAVAAPFATARLADAGADVHKIERPEGDFARGYDRAAGSVSSYFAWLNRGKRSVVLDLKTAEARAELAALVAEADVFVQNLKPGAAARLGFDPAVLCAQYSRLISCSISGFDDSGPNAGRKAYDLLIQAESGLCSLTGGPSEPARVGISVVDIATGATAHAAILEALIARGQTGEGADIRVSMFDVMADWLAVPLLNHEAGNTPRRVGLAHPSIAPYGVFATGDGAAILISVQSDREWGQLCDHLLARPALATDPRFATNLARTDHRGETDSLLAAAFAGLTRSEALARLVKADTAYAEVNDMAGLSRHSELKRIVVHVPGGEASLPRPAAVFRGAERRLGPVPALGEDGA
ncbi:MAG: CaiB/BaiF CoA-transferase family protein [Pseudomonadota bacterium]